MTTIVGIARDGVVHLGGDSAQFSGDWVKHQDVASKVFCLGVGMDTMIVGISGDPRVRDAIEAHFTPPPCDSDTRTYLTGPFADALRSCLREHNVLIRERDREQIAEDSVLLLGFRGRLFAMWSTFALSEPSEQHYAVGSGGKAARGALDVLERLNVHDMRKRVEYALFAAAADDAATGAPFTYTAAI